MAKTVTIWQSIEQDDDSTVYTFAWAPHCANWMHDYENEFREVIYNSRINELFGATYRYKDTIIETLEIPIDSAKYDLYDMVYGKTFIEALRNAEEKAKGSIFD